MFTIQTFCRVKILRKNSKQQINGTNFVNQAPRKKLPALITPIKFE